MANPALDSCLKLISDPCRREIIRLLRAEGGEVTVDGLLERLSWEENGAAGAPSEPLAAELCHIHLPKLATNGIIEYEPGDGRVRYRPDNQIEAVLDSLPAELTSVSS